MNEITAFHAFVVSVCVIIMVCMVVLGYYLTRPDPDVPPSLWDAGSYKVTCVFRGANSPDREFVIDGYLLFDGRWISGFSAKTLLKEKMGKLWIEIDGIFWNRNEIINYTVEKSENKILWTKENCINYVDFQ